MPKLKISQSLLKNYQEYKFQRYCGLLFKARYVDQIRLPDAPSEAMELGIFFEYNAFGGLPRSGRIPEGKIAKSGENAGMLTSVYQRAQEQAENARMMMEAYKFKVKKVSPEIQTDIALAHLDLIAEDMRESVWDGKKELPNPDYQKEIIIDFKYSGLLENKWDPIGWEVESLSDKPLLMIQPTHYKWIYSMVNEGRLPTFYFALFDSGKNMDRKLLRINIDKDVIMRHSDTVEERYEEISYENDITGFKPYPSVLNCAKCPLTNTCEYSLNVPLIQDIYVGQ